MYTNSLHRLVRPQYNLWSLATRKTYKRNQHTPADVGPAIVVPTPYREEENRLEQLRVQRAAIARDRERKEEIDRMRAEEERLDRAIAELEGRQY
jgi:hypothetical protein